MRMPQLAGHRWPGLGRTTACSRRLPESARASLPLPGAAEAQRSMDRRSISITSSRCTLGEVTPERTAKGSMPHVITNDTAKASPPVNRRERHAGKLARAVLRGGGDGDTAS
jgi:hypothetical protein